MSLCRYSAPFGPDLCVKSVSSGSVGVCISGSKSEVCVPCKKKDPNVAVTTGVNQCCHLVDTVFAVLLFLHYKKIGLDIFFFF